MNNELVSKSVYLLDTINAFAVDYLPMLQRIMIKATTAAIADHKEGDSTAATVQETSTADGTSSASIDATTANPSAATVGTTDTTTST